MFMGRARMRVRWEARNRKQKEAAFSGSCESDISLNFGPRHLSHLILVSALFPENLRHFTCAISAHPENPLSLRFPLIKTLEIKTCHLLLLLIFTLGDFVHWFLDSGRKGGAGREREREIQTSAGDGTKNPGTATRIHALDQELNHDLSVHGQHANH